MSEATKLARGDVDGEVASCIGRELAALLPPFDVRGEAGRRCKESFTQGVLLAHAMLLRDEIVADGETNLAPRHGSKVRGIAEATKRSVRRLCVTLLCESHGHRRRTN